MKNSRPRSPLRWAKADREYTLDPVPALGERLTSLPLATILRVRSSRVRPGWEPLMLALLQRDRAMVELLLQHGADPNQPEDVRADPDVYHGEEAARKD